MIEGIFLIPTLVHYKTEECQEHSKCLEYKQFNSAFKFSVISEENWHEISSYAYKGASGNMTKTKNCWCNFPHPKTTAFHQIQLQYHFCLFRLVRCLAHFRQLPVLMRCRGSNFRTKQRSMCGT
jgi:hypothetical protein